MLLVANVHATEPTPLEHQWFLRLVSTSSLFNDQNQGYSSYGEFLNNVSLPSTPSGTNPGVLGRHFKLNLGSSTTFPYQACPLPQSTPESSHSFTLATLRQKLSALLHCDSNTWHCVLTHVPFLYKPPYRPLSAPCLSLPFFTQRQASINYNSASINNNSTTNDQQQHKSYVLFLSVSILRLLVTPLRRLRARRQKTFLFEIGRNLSGLSCIIFFATTPVHSAQVTLLCPHLPQCP